MKFTACATYMRISSQFLRYARVLEHYRDNRTVPGAIIMRFSFRLHLMIVEAYSTPICCHNTATQHTIYMKRKLQS